MRKKAKILNIGQYLYENQKEILQRMFPKKKMKDIKKVIRYV